MSGGQFFSYNPADSQGFIRINATRLKVNDQKIKRGKSLLIVFVLGGPRRLLLLWC
jgi:hypothetical protein